MKEGEIMSTTKRDKPAEIRPSIYLSDKDLPEIKNWEVGEEYWLAVEVRLSSKSISEENGKKAMRASFEILKIKSVDGSAGTKDFKEFEEKYGSKK